MNYKLILLMGLLSIFTACAVAESPPGELEAVRSAAEEIPQGTDTSPAPNSEPATNEPPPSPSPLPTVTASQVVTAESTSFTAYDDRVRIIGRFDAANPQKLAFDWSAVAIEFTFSGTSLTIYLEDGRNSYNVSVDEQQQILKTEPGQEAYLIADDLPPGEHTVRIAKRTEAYVGAAVFKGGQIEGGALGQLSPPPQRSLEFIGDSITTGYGNEGESPDCWFTPDSQNAEKTYAAMIGNELDAQVALIALSGLGVVRNLREESAVSPETAVAFIDRALGLNPSIAWPPEQGTPDAVVINLGTNDYSSVPFPEDEAFIEAYVSLLRAVRARYAKTPIFAVAGPLMLEPAPRVIESSVERFRADAGDELVTYVLIEDNLERSGEDFGCDWHPNVNGHQKIAAQLAPIVAEQLGW